ncbi:16S rRNA (cytosine(1402)-N(4))-methyltransferase RsmH [Candidatus Ishikawella capsulata]|nr:16S rRNA (cytosine(1402)-N(4))-methyltransferase RsmH [Candidatus Ishikawaella capsulata]
MQKHEHIPVFLHEAINGLNIVSDGIYIDATFGRGGHSCLILSKLNKKGKLISIDRDPEAVATASRIEDSRFSIIYGLFSNLEKYVIEHKLMGKIDGILLDLGVSSPQLDIAERGFSFMKDGPLDMRMDPLHGYSAAEWLKDAKETDIAYVLKIYGEERFAKRIAHGIVEYKKRQPITSTKVLADIIRKAIPFRKQFKHSVTRSFQAIRIFINNELGEIEKVLHGSLKVLKPKGRLVVISFHSLEDRIIKYFIKNYSNDRIFPPKLPITEDKIKEINQKKFKIIVKMVANKMEINKNYRARSAIMRIAERTVQ